MPRLSLVAICLAALVVACPSSDLPPEPPHTETVSPAAACARLRALGCPEGDDACEGTITRMSRLVAPNTGCIADAATVDAVRWCGTVRCLP